MLAALSTPEFAPLLRLQATEAAPEAITGLHSPHYLQHLRDLVPEQGHAYADPDTYLAPASLRAALLAAGAGMQAVDLIVQGRAGNAFCATRPPGHHAERETAMGFCLFGNVVSAARHALDHHGLDRVAIADFDVHHGNGTQDLVWNDPRIAFVSSHQVPLYPGTGSAAESGGSGNILNIPLPPGTGGAAFRQLWQDRARPFLRGFEPQFLFVSAGFDAHRADPLGGLNLGTEDFAWVTHLLCDLADACAGGRIVSTLEGGYDLDALAASAAAHVRVLMERGR